MGLYNELEVHGWNQLVEGKHANQAGHVQMYPEEVNVS